MCCLFGLIDPNHAYTGKQKAKILHVLATASEARGTDATGYAMLRDRKLIVYKRPVPGHKLQFRIQDDTTVVMGHTRMTTQGDETRNENNHPFIGSIAGRPFALAHNGVLWNDKELRQKLKLPRTKIETDSYIAVQLLESQASLDFASLKYMAEQVRGTFTFTVLTDTNELYFVRGDNPLCLCRFQSSGLYLYASTSEIMQDALRRLPFLQEKPILVDLNSSEILRVDASGALSRGNFDDTHLYTSAWFPPVRPRSNDLRSEYIHDLKTVAEAEGYDPHMIDYWLYRGYTLLENEEFIYDGVCC